MDFNTKAKNWDNKRRADRAKIIAIEIIKSINIKNNFNALEFGCGTGLISFCLSDRFKHITLIDTSKGMIEILRKKIQDSNAKNMTAFQADINSGFVSNEKYNVIYTSMVLHHIKDTKMVLKNLYKLLDVEGSICIIDLVEDDGSFHKSEKDFDGHNGFNQKELKEILKEIGFKNVVTKTFYTDNKIIDSLKIKYSLFIMVGKK